MYNVDGLIMHLRILHHWGPCTVARALAMITAYARLKVLGMTKQLTKYISTMTAMTIPKSIRLEPKAAQIKNNILGNEGNMKISIRKKVIFLLAKDSGVRTLEKPDILSQGFFRVL